MVQGFMEQRTNALGLRGRVQETCPNGNNQHQQVQQMQEGWHGPGLYGAKDKCPWVTTYEAEIKKSTVCTDRTGIHQQTQQMHDG